MKRYKSGKGWFRESYRHSLSAKGVKTVSRNVNHSLKGDVSVGYSKLKDQAKFYDTLWLRNKGIFYRGTSNGKGLGIGAMGKGTYVTWRIGMAKAFSEISRERTGGKPRVERYKLPRDIKLLDSQSKTMGDIKKSLGVKPWDVIDDKVFISILTHEVQKRGYDGVISDDVADGIVIFDESKIQKI